MYRHIAKKPIKKLKCEICRTYLKTEYGQVSHPAADLVNIKSEGFFYHPNRHVFRIIVIFESSFKNHADSPNVLKKHIKICLFCCQT